MAFVRPRNMADRNQVGEKHDTLIERLPADHPVNVALKSMVSTPLQTWRDKRGARQIARGRWTTAVKKVIAADKKNDGRIRTAFRLILLKHGQEAVDDLIARAGGNSMSDLTKMPVDRLLVVLADLFASVDGAAEPPVYKDDLEKLRESTAELAAASAEESDARTVHGSATSAELIAEGALDLAATRYALFVEGLYGEAEAEQYLPALAPRRRKPSAKPAA